MAIPPIEEINKMAKRNRALCVKFEPLLAADCELLAAWGFAPDPAPSLSTRTAAVDLAPPVEKMFAGFPTDGGRTRRSIRDARGREIRVIFVKGTGPTFDGDLRKFHHLLSRTGKRQRFINASFNQLKAKTDAFGNKALLFLAYSKKGDENPLAGALVLTHEKTAYYHHAASSGEGQRLQAPYILMWEIIKAMKDMGFETLDLGGIYDPRYHRNTGQWRGFSVFKKKFGGIENEHPTPLVKYYHLIFKFLAKIGLSV